MYKPIPQATFPLSDDAFVDYLREVGSIAGAWEDKACQIILEMVNVHVNPESIVYVKTMLKRLRDAKLILAQHELSDCKYVVRCTTVPVPARVDLLWTETTPVTIPKVIISAPIRERVGVTAVALYCPAFQPLA